MRIATVTINSTSVNPRSRSVRLIESLLVRAAIRMNIINEKARPCLQERASPREPLLLDLVDRVEAGAAGHVVVLDEAHALEEREDLAVAVQVARRARGERRGRILARRVVLVR